MGLAEAYRSALGDDTSARLRRVIALRAMVADGMSSAQIADRVSVDQAVVDQQFRLAPDLTAVHPAELLAAAAPVLRALADEHGHSQLAVFGSVARGEAHHDSDIDLLVQPPEGQSSFELMSFKLLIEQVVARSVDLVSYGSLTPGIDDDIRRDATLL